MERAARKEEEAIALYSKIAETYLLAKSWPEFRLRLFMDLGMEVSWWTVRGFWFDLHPWALTCSCLGFFLLFGGLGFILPFFLDPSTVEKEGIFSCLLVGVSCGLVGFMAWMYLMKDAWEKASRFLRNVKKKYPSFATCMDFASMYPSMIKSL